MSRSIYDVMLEALIIGIMNVVLIMGLNSLGSSYSPLAIHFLAGALIHILFEYSGGNKWWCEQTYKL